MLVLAGAFVPTLAHTSTLVAATVYLGYGASRVLAFALDGTPAPGLVVAAIVELAIGYGAAHQLPRRRTNEYRGNPEPRPASSSFAEDRAGS